MIHQDLFTWYYKLNLEPCTQANVPQLSYSSCLQQQPFKDRFSGSFGRSQPHFMAEAGFDVLALLLQLPKWWITGACPPASQLSHHPTFLFSYLYLFLRHCLTKLLRIYPSFCLDCVVLSGSIPFKSHQLSAHLPFPSAFAFFVSRSHLIATPPNHCVHLSPICGLFS